MPGIFFQGIRNEPEEKRRAARLQLAAEAAAKTKAVLPKTLRLMQRITQHSVKFIRWVAAQLWNSIPWQQACAVLTAPLRQVMTRELWTPLQGAFALRCLNTVVFRFMPGIFSTFDAHQGNFFCSFLLCSDEQSSPAFCRS